MQPAASEDIEGPGGDKQKLRTLAGKLLSRKSSKVAGEGHAGAGGGSLDRLAFGGHQLSREAERRSRNKSGGLAGECIDEEASLHSDSNADDDISGLCGVPRRWHVCQLRQACMPARFCRPHWQDCQAQGLGH